MPRAVLIACLVLATLALAACESSQTKSARLEKTGKGKAQLTTITAGAANTAIKVGATTVLTSDSGKAAVVELQNTGPVAEVQVPLVITVKDAGGKPLYKNDIKGLQPSLQQLAFLDKGQKAYWVNDQVLAGKPPKSVDVAVGKAKGTASAPVPRITLGPAKLESDSSGAYATAEIKNESKLTQINLPIFAVALKGGKVVAAGRAIIEKLAPAPTKKPVFYKIFFIGNPKGAQLQVAAAPTILQEGQTS
jgi:hypothetical protein